ncbi:hypothetical protein [Methylobacterium mesophilicum]|uniref:hypothetical protein n=1 Tax=Methylobacterium mesophilicum TaxID=39956 RepID=UPI002F35F229
MTENIEAANSSAEDSVVERILHEFVAAVSAEEDFEEISRRLKSTLIIEKDFSDSALELALFGAAQS